SVRIIGPKKGRTAVKKHVIDIHNVCQTTPNQSEKAVKTDTIQWRTGLFDAWSLRLPGGVFYGHPNDFTLLISGVLPQPATALVVNTGGPVVISNYIYDSNGHNCIRTSNKKSKKRTANPPEILIGSRARPAGKTKK